MIMYNKISSIIFQDIMKYYTRNHTFEDLNHWCYMVVIKKGVHIIRILTYQL